MAFKAYYILPIDFGWEYLPTVEEFADKLAKSDLAIKLGKEPFGDPKLDQFLADFATAQDLATDQGWEGDFRGSPRVFFVPVEGEFVYGFAWKQDNNGDTLVVSPQPLSWLDALVCN